VKLGGTNDGMTRQKQIPDRYAGIGVPYGLIDRGVFFKVDQ
jgi:hypothetical protein